MSEAQQSCAQQVVWPTLCKSANEHAPLKRDQLGVWTLIIGSIANVEKATSIKIGGVFAALLGISLTSIVDILGDTDQNRGSFPHKSHVQIAFGDVLALISAILYGLYTTLMKKKAGNEARINLLLFFGFVGFFNMIILFPGLFVLHYTGVERFELPPTGRITAIVMVCNAPQPRSRSELILKQDQHGYLLHFRRVLGLRNAANIAFGGNSWPQPNNSTFACRSDFSQRPNSQPYLLGWCWNRVCGVYSGQP